MAASIGTKFIYAMPPLMAKKMPARLNPWLSLESDFWLAKSSRFVAGDIMPGSLICEPPSNVWPSTACVCANNTVLPNMQEERAEAQATHNFAFSKVDDGK